MLSRAGRLCRIASASITFAGVGVSSGGAQSAAEVKELIESNRRLQEQMRAQQATIETLNGRLAELGRASERHERELRGLSDRVDGAGGGAATAAAPRARETGAVRVAAEAGLAFFKTGAQGQFPKGEFRADDPVVSIEAPVMKDVYLFTELRLLSRETNTEDFELGEIYVDFENVLARFGRDGLLNVRVGRLNIPFGEEYLVRGPVANPLISHSLSDIWGVDEGVEVYGKIGPASYVLAVQNGGVSRLRDFHEDKSVTARVGWQPARWLRVSGSAMRTGKLTVAGDSLSEVWFGNAFFRALGGTATTTTFAAELWQGDAIARWKGGQASAALGVAHFDDNDTRADNSRRLRYGYAEVVQEIVGELYGAARYSEIRAPKGYPLAGWGTMGAFFFRPGALTEELRRMSVGLGYRFGAPLVLKVEYAWESGRQVSGAKRDQENFFGTELGVRF